MNRRNVKSNIVHVFATIKSGEPIDTKGYYDTKANNQQLEKLDIPAHLSSPMSIRFAVSSSTLSLAASSNDRTRD